MSDFGLVGDDDGVPGLAFTNTLEMAATSLHPLLSQASIENQKG